MHGQILEGTVWMVGLATVVSAVSLTYGAPASSVLVGPSGFPEEEMHDTYVGRDETVTDFRIAVSGWPDCYSNASAIADIFRLEGVQDKSDHEKVMALWKWYRILFMPKYGGYYYELRDSSPEPQIVYDPHKLFTVYGRHYCDGTAWVMAGLWRAAGYIAFDQCHHSHTIPSLRYRDHDGHYRFHDFEPEDDAYYWDEGRGIVGTWTMPLLRGRVHRHLVFPQVTHTLRRSLRVGETVQLRWDNDGYFIPHGRQGPQIAVPKGYEPTPGRQDGVYAAIGQETQRFTADVTEKYYTAALYDGSENTGWSAPHAGKATLHPSKAGMPARFVYRLPSPFVAVDGEVTASLVKAHEDDLCRLLLSLDRGRTWIPIFTKEKAGAEDVVINIGREARGKGLPNVYSRYEVLVAAEFNTSGDPRSTGMNALQVTIHRQLNKRTLPNLRPGRNVFRITGSMPSDMEIRLSIDYSVNGEARGRTVNMDHLPFYFEIDTGDVAEHIVDNYDQSFNVGALRMKSIEFAVRPHSGDPCRSLPAEYGEPFFRQAAPHPAVLASKKIAVRTPETDIIQTNGFFPQNREVRQDPHAVQKLLNDIRTGRDRGPWIAAEELGKYPEALDALLDLWPDADIDLTVFLCKALAQIADPKAIEPVLKKWREQGEAGAPGTRYIPDVLAAIGDRRVVPDLIAPLKTMRFDFRFHIAYALSVLGGLEAETALRDLAENDPFPAIREFAAEALQKMSK